MSELSLSMWWDVQSSLVAPNIGIGGIALFPHTETWFEHAEPVLARQVNLTEQTSFLRDTKRAGTDAHHPTRYIQLATHLLYVLPVLLPFTALVCA